MRVDGSQWTRAQRSFLVNTKQIKIFCALIVDSRTILYSAPNLVASITAGFLDLLELRIDSLTIMHEDVFRSGQSVASVEQGFSRAKLLRSKFGFM